MQEDEEKTSVVPDARQQPEKMANPYSTGGHGVCMKCASTQRIKPNNVLLSYCCGEPIPQIDDLMVPTIVELVKRGYTTAWSCSGHAAEEQDTAYISFWWSVGADLVEARLPDYFYVDRQERNKYGHPVVGIYASVNHHSEGLNVAERLERLIQINRDLLAWAQSLPPREPVEVFNPWYHVDVLGKNSSGHSWTCKEAH